MGHFEQFSNNECPQIFFIIMEFSRKNNLSYRKRVGMIREKNIFLSLTPWIIGNQYHSLVESKMTFTSYYDPTSATAAAIAGAIEGSIGLIMNTLNIFVILKSKKLRNNAIAPLLCALAFSDITFCLTLILVVFQFYNNEPFQEESFLCYFAPISYR